MKLKTVKEDIVTHAEDKEESEDDEKAKKPNIKIKEKKQQICVDLFTVKVKGLTYKSKKKDIKQFFHPLKPKSIRIPPKLKGIAYVGFATEKEMKKALIKHLSFLGK